MRKLLFLSALLPLASTGCVSTVAHVVTAPVRAAGQVVDWTTTSRSESDRNYGRRMRRQEARAEHDRRGQYEECRRHGDASACRAQYYGSQADSETR